MAWAVAALAAGPVYVLLVMALPLIRANTPAPWGLVFIVPLAIAFGLIVAVLPIGVMIYAGAWLGARAARWRHPLVWGLVGALCGPALGTLFDVTRLGTLWQGALAGAAVAGIARRLVRWRDPAVL